MRVRVRVIFSMPGLALKVGVASSVLLPVITLYLYIRLGAYCPKMRIISLWDSLTAQPSQKSVTRLKEGVQARVVKLKYSVDVLSLEL